LIFAAVVVAQADPTRGKAIVEGSGGCLACHRVDDKGTQAGVDLTEIGSARTAEQLEKALTDPSAEVHPQNRLYRVTTREGITVTGKLLNQDQFSLQMLDGKGRLVAFQRSNLRESGFIPTPSMPSYKEKLNPQQLQDVIRFLATLKAFN